MNMKIFETYVQTQLAPTLSSGDVVILDNVAFHKSPKLKALLRKHAARTFDAITDALGQICDLYSITECKNYFKAAGYEVE